MRVGALLPGIGFFNTQRKCKGGRRKWEGERGTWPDFQSCSRTVHLGKSCASSEPLPGGYLKIGCGGPASHTHPRQFFASRCYSEPAALQQQRLDSASAPAQAPTVHHQEGGSIPGRGRIIFAAPLSASSQLQSGRCFQNPSAHFAKWKQQPGGLKTPACPWGTRDGL